MREDEMIQPEEGPQFRDIVNVTPVNRWYYVVTMSCGHTKQMSRAGYKKWHLNAATLCMECIK